MTTDVLLERKIQNTNRTKSKIKQTSSLFLKVCINNALMLSIQNEGFPREM